MKQIINDIPSILLIFELKLNNSNKIHETINSGVSFFIVFFVYGCLVMKDYGISVDEIPERNSSHLEKGEQMTVIKT